MSIKKKEFYKDLLKFAAVFAVAMLVFFSIGHLQAHMQQPTALIKGSLSLLPERPHTDDPTKIQPGTPVKIALKIENKGKVPIPAGTAYVRFAFIQPLHNRHDSVLFRTDTVEVAAMAPGEVRDLLFTPHHLIPSVIDFVRSDWLMRQYEAVYVVDGNEYLIATMPITFSVYYYPILPGNLMVELPAAH